MTTFSFQKVVTDIKNYCESHAVVSQFYYEREYDMEGSTEADYPAVVVERSTSQLLAGENVFSLDISVIDLPKENETDKLTIHSKCIKILEDISARFRLGETAQYTIINDPSPEPIAHEKNDRIEGWGATFDFSVRADGDGCEYPTNG